MNENDLDANYSTNNNNYYNNNDNNDKRNSYYYYPDGTGAGYKITPPQPPSQPQPQFPQDQTEAHVPSLEFDKLRDPYISPSGPTHVEIVPSDSSEGEYDQGNNNEIYPYDEETPKFTSVQEWQEYNEQRLSKQPANNDDYNKEPKFDIQKVEESFENNEDEQKNSKKKKKKKKKIKKYIPYFTLLLTLIQVVLLVAMLIVGGFEPWYENPMIGPPPSTLQDFGAKVSSLMRAPHWQIWRFLSAWLLHGGVIHIVMNLLFQVTVCLRLERYWGPFRIGPIYILSGIGGTLLSAIFLPTVISIGASSCLAGLMGALLTNVLVNWAVVPKPGRQLISLSIQIFIFLLIGILPIVDNFAHVGGLVTGFFSGLIFIPKFATTGKRIVWFLRIAGIVCTLVFFIIFTTLFFALEDFQCGICFWLNPSWQQIFSIFGIDLPSIQG